MAATSFWTAFQEEQGCSDYGLNKQYLHWALRCHGMSHPDVICREKVQTGSPVSHQGPIKDLWNIQKPSKKKQNT